MDSFFSQLIRWVPNMIFTVRLKHAGWRWQFAKNGRRLLQRSGAPLFLFLAFSLTVSANPASAHQEEEPRFEASHFSVPVEVVVTDRRGRIVANLTKENFRVFEDGVPQEIDSFQFVTFKARPPVQEEVAADAIFETAPTEDQADSAAKSECLRLNFVVFLIDLAGTPFHNQQRVIDSVAQHLKDRVQQCDRRAVFAVGRTFHMVHNFTNSAQRLSEAVSGMAPMDSQRAATSVQPEAAVPRHLSQSDLAERTAQVDELHGENPLAGYGPELLATLAAGRTVDSYRRMLSHIDEREGRSLLGAIEALARGLAEVPGRKNIVLFSQGFTVGSPLEEAFERAINRANNSGVSIYAIDSQGLTTGELREDSRPRTELSESSPTHDASSPLSRTIGGSRIDARGGDSLFDRARSAGSDAKESALRHLTASTGGFSVHRTNDFTRALSRIDENLRSYYLLAYQPSRPQMDGSYRTIEVRTAGIRDDYTLHHRTGYVALPPGMEILSQEEFQVLNSLERGETASLIEASMQGGWFHVSRETGVLVLSLQMTPDHLLCADSETVAIDPEAAGNCLVDLMGLVRDELGFPMQKFGSLEYPIIDGPRPDASGKAGGFRTHMALELAPGAYTVQVVLRDRIGGAAGFVQRPFRLSEFSEPLALSSVVISDTVTAAGTGDGFLTVDDVSVIPTPEPTFRSGEKLVYLFKVYVTAEEPREAEFEVIVEARHTGRSQPIRLTRATVKKELQAGLTTIPFARFAQLDGLEAGTYLVDVQVRDLDTREEAKVRSMFRIEE